MKVNYKGKVDDHTGLLYHYFVVYLLKTNRKMVTIRDISKDKAFTDDEMVSA